VHLLIAVDPGKRSDPTGIVVCERVRSTSPESQPVHTWPTPFKVPRSSTTFVVREIGRLALGTSHREGALKIAYACHDARVLDPDGRLSFVLDCTGIGEALADMLEGYLPSSVTAIRCWFTGTERLEKRGREWHVGKPWMLSRLTSLLESGRVRLPTTPQAQALTEELRDYQFSITASGNMVSGARTGAHDDLVTALGLACLMDASAGPKYSGRDLYSDYRPLPVDEPDWESLHRSPSASW